MHRPFLIFLILTACGLLGCAKSGTAAEPVSYCRHQTFEGSRFTVCDNRGGELKLFAAAANEPPLRSFDEVSREVPTDRVAFAMNAGMFDDNGRPIGLAQTGGRQLHKINFRDGFGNFHMKPNGVFLVTCGGAPAIFQTDRMPVFRCAPRLATQSGPMLVIGGKLHPKIEPDGTSRYIRNGVGVKGSKALFVISDDPVSFGKFARFFRDVLKTPNALFFDGSVSSLWDPASYRMDNRAKLGPIIVAFKPEASKPGRATRAKS